MEISAYSQDKECNGCLIWWHGWWLNGYWFSSKLLSFLLLSTGPLRRWHYFNSTMTINDWEFEKLNPELFSYGLAHDIMLWSCHSVLIKLHCGSVFETRCDLWNIQSPGLDWLWCPRIFIWNWSIAYVSEIRTNQHVYLHGLGMFTGFVQF